MQSAAKRCGLQKWQLHFHHFPLPPFAGFFQAKHLIFRHFLSYNYVIAKGRLLRARRQLGSSSCPRSAVHVHKAWVTVATRCGLQTLTSVKHHETS